MITKRIFCIVYLVYAKGKHEVKQKELAILEYYNTVNLIYEKINKQ